MDSTTAAILSYFERLCAIPRPSGGEAAAVSFLQALLQKAGLRCETDPADNLRCVLPGSDGMEAAPSVILQAHIDMVCTSDPNGHYRPGLDPIRTKIDGDFLCSDGQSSLGADNGIGAALMLWLALDAKLPYPPLMLLFTTGEEQGMTGAKALNPVWLEGYSYYINLDAFRSDAIIVASAGGLRQSWCHPIMTHPAGGTQFFLLTLSGLTGGHSGFDINKGRLNALAALTDFLRTCPGELAALQGGSSFNAIPTEAKALLAVNDPGPLQAAVTRWSAALQNHRNTDPNLTVSLEPHPPANSAWSADTRRQVLAFLTQLPQGVLSRQPDFPDTLACSGNLAQVISSTEGQLTVLHMGRAASWSALTALAREMNATAQTFEFIQQTKTSYAPWEGSFDSSLVQQICSIRRLQDGLAMKPLAVHVGLESSILLEKAPHLTGVSLGFDILDAHSTRERVKLSSIHTTAILLQQLLQQLGKEEIL